MNVLQCENGGFPKAWSLTVYKCTKKARMFVHLYGRPRRTQYSHSFCHTHVVLHVQNVQLPAKDTLLFGTPSGTPAKYTLPLPLHGGKDVATNTVELPTKALPGENGKHAGRKGEGLGTKETLLLP